MSIGIGLIRKNFAIVASEGRIILNGDIQSDSFNKTVDCSEVKVIAVFTGFMGTEDWMICKTLKEKIDNISNEIIYPTRIDNCYKSIYDEIKSISHEKVGHDYRGSNSVACIQEKGEFILKHYSYSIDSNLQSNQYKFKATKGKRNRNYMLIGDEKAIESILSKYGEIMQNEDLDEHPAIELLKTTIKYGIENSSFLENSETRSCGGDFFHAAILKN